jgi:predicted RNA-binding Zn-ribbon protein involved in translation (DUF1610 family)
MSGYEGACPACGATIVFRLGSSLLKVCDHCGSAVARKGADLSSYGKVAQLIPTPSVLKLGLEGGYSGAPRFTLIGRLQLDHGAGTWDEWLMGFDNGSMAWLSESQGKFHYLAEAPLPPAPSFEHMRAGQTIDLGPPGTFVIHEAREARFASAQGELPFDVEPGRMLRYADLSGPGGQFATLDYGTGNEAEALYIGREVALEQLGFHDLPTDDERRRKVGAKSLSCTQCGGPLEIRAPDQTQRVACPYCGSLLDATKDFAVLEALGKTRLKPFIPLGSKGRLAGAEWTTIGFMERSVTIEGIRYPWHEYLLYDPRHGFRWLVVSSGHWSFVEPAHAGDVEGHSWPGAKRYQGRTFKHYQTAVANVDHVIGEFYWAVAKGDKVEAADYVSPPYVLSMEREIQRAVAPSEGSEITWSLGTYMEPEEIWKAFRLPGRPLAKHGVGANQPSPYSGKAGALMGRAFLFAAILFFLFVGISIVGGRVVHSQRIATPTTVAPATPEAAAFVGPIEVADHSNLHVGVDADVDNSWLYLAGSLINENTGVVDDFDLEASYYHGRDSDGAWTEGSRRASRSIPSVAPGRYTVRLEPQWQAGKTPPAYDLTIRSRVPGFGRFLLAAFALFAWPLLVAWKHVRFEYRRWSESDHPWMESS